MDAARYYSIYGVYGISVFAVQKPAARIEPARGPSRVQVHEGHTGGAFAGSTHHDFSILLDATLPPCERRLV